MKTLLFAILGTTIPPLIALLGLAFLSSVVRADWLGLGQASEAIAGATWKVVAINAIESAKFVILMGFDLWALAWVAGKLGSIIERVTQDNKVTGAERVLVGLYFLAVGAVAFIALPLGYKLLGRLFS